MIKNKKGLFKLLGVPETSVLPASPGDTIIVHVDEGSSEEMMWAYGNKIKELLPDHKILVLPKNIRMSYFSEDYASRMIGVVK
jgi:hypothetical protein